VSTVTADAEVATRRLTESTRFRTALGYLGLALIAYVPVFRSSPGKVAADTKQYLYLDPTRMLGRATSMWEPNNGMGQSPTRTSATFLMGPYTGCWTGSVSRPDRSGSGWARRFARRGVLPAAVVRLAGPGIVARARLHDAVHARLRLASPC
jgi:hypothetical protein